MGISLVIQQWLHNIVVVTAQSQSVRNVPQNRLVTSHQSVG